MDSITRLARVDRRLCLAMALAGVVLLGDPSVANCSEPEPGNSLRSSQKKALVVCADPAAMPRTHRAKDGSPQGADLAVAQLVCRELGRELEIHWCAGACYWRCLHSGRCDMVVGQPHGSGPSTEVAWSTPYGGGQFGLVVPREAKGIRSFADLHGKTVGVVAGTVAPTSKDLAVIQFKTREALLSQMPGRKLDAAFVDADFAAWYLHTHPKLLLRQVAEFVPHERWNVGFAVRADEKDLLDQINQALAKILKGEKFRAAFSALGMQHRPAFKKEAPGRAATYDSWKRIQYRGELVVAIDPANLPYSSAKEEQPGFDVELARLLATQLGVKLRLNWFDVHRETAVGELLDRNCDLAMGVAIDPNAFDDDGALSKKVLYSRPYYGTGYLLVGRKDGVRIGGLSDLKGAKSRRLGAEAGSIADYRLRQRGYLRRLFRTQLSVLKSLDDGGLDYAYLWSNVGWTLHTSPEFNLEIIPNYTPEDHWNIAIAMRRGDDQLKRRVDDAVKKLVADGSVSRILARYHVPYFPAFEKDPKQDKPHSNKKASTSPDASRDVSARGIEPRMYGRQRSKKGYSGLERIRAAGRLIVGLDQNNLPFSTAHPEPAGLDFEIASLLAKQLNVSLEVFWGYSSHDSYPSKLATKKFCDVMLGVMPDDRFAKRVLFSKPYYHANYQLVVSSGGKPPIGLSDLGEQPLAIVRGVAVREVRDRPLRRFASQAAVLKAVATGQVKAGYVISARGAWLAEQRWPGKLRFIDIAGSRDRFPICAAVRKADVDLKAAIERALEALDRSGQLAKVFARWRIPYEMSEKTGEPAN